MRPPPEMAGWIGSSRAEARIGKLAAAGQAELPSLIATHPKDGFLRLGTGWD